MSRETLLLLLLLLRPLPPLPGLPTSPRRLAGALLRLLRTRCLPHPLTETTTMMTARKAGALLLLVLRSKEDKVNKRLPAMMTPAAETKTTPKGSPPAKKQRTWPRASQ